MCLQGQILCGVHSMFVTKWQKTIENAKLNLNTVKFYIIFNKKLSKLKSSRKYETYTFSVHSLACIFTPLPQVLEQSDHSLHLPQLFLIVTLFFKLFSISEMNRFMS